MSGNICWIVDVDATSEEASDFAQRGTNWLVLQGIVEPTPDSAHSLDNAGLYRPGPKAAAWSEELVIESPLCGLEVATGRTVFHTGDGSDAIRCPNCSARHDLDNIPWSDAVEQWHAGEPDDTLTCPTCSHSAPIVDYTFLELDWAFGNLGFGFNDWMIDPRLASELGNALGHRMKVVYQHI